MRKFISTLAHSKDLDYEKFRKVTRGESNEILDLIGKAKFDGCYVISENIRIDGQFLDIHKALEETIGYVDAFGVSKIKAYSIDEENEPFGKFFRTSEQ